MDSRKHCKTNCSKSTKTNKCDYDKESRWNDSIDSLEMHTGSRTPYTQGSEVINTWIGREFYIEAWGNITGFAEWSFMQTLRKSAKTSVTTDAENYKSYLQSFLPLTQWGACWSPCHPAAWSPRALGRWGLLCKHSLPLWKEKTEKKQHLN